MKNYKFKFLAVSLIVYSFLLLACPKETAVHKAARASYELSGLSRDAIAATQKAFDDKIIGVQVKNDIAAKLQIIIKGGQEFNAITTAINNGSAIPTDKLALLNTILSDEIAGPFLEILSLLKVLPESQAPYLHAALAALRTAILTISAVVSEDTMRKIQWSEAYV